MGTPTSIKLSFARLPPHGVLKVKGACWIRQPLWREYSGRFDPLRSLFFVSQDFHSGLGGQEKTIPSEVIYNFLQDFCAITSCRNEIQIRFPSVIFPLQLRHHVHLPELHLKYKGFKKLYIYFTDSTHHGKLTAGTLEDDFLVRWGGDFFPGFNGVNFQGV